MSIQSLKSLGWGKLVVMILVSFAGLAAPARAAVEDFVITEIMYDAAGADAAKEWVEVFHKTTSSATVVGGSVSNSLRFYDGSKNRTLAASAAQGSMTIDPQTYFILARDAANFKLLYPAFAGTIIEVTALDLGNTSETIGFRTGASGNLFSSLTYQKTWGGAGTGRTLEKKVITGADDSSNWVESAADGGSPGSAYSAPALASSTTDYPTSVRINEFLPDPESGDEWVELFNNSSSQKVSLSDWKLDDIEGGSSPQTFKADLDANGYFVLYFRGNKLNNSGDSLRLIRPDGVVSDSFNYSGSTKGATYAFDGSAFVQTKTPTPGSANLLTPIKDKHKGKIMELRKLPVGSVIELDALVTAPTNIFGEKTFFLSDGDSGVKVVYESEPPFKIEVADRVSLASSIEEANGEKYVKTAGVKLVRKGERYVEERNILTGEAREEFEGMLVKVAGKLVENSGDTFYLDDESGRAKIYLRDSTGIVKAKMTVGDSLRITGILSQYGFLKSGEANYRIMPRFQSDVVNKTESEAALVKILGSSTTTGAGTIKELPATGTFDFYTLAWIQIFLGLWLRYRFLNEKMLNDKC